MSVNIYYKFILYVYKYVFDTDCMRYYYYFFYNLICMNVCMYGINII